MATDRVSAERLGQPLVIDVTIDVNDVVTMGRFWETVLGYDRAFEREGHLYLVDPSGRGPHIYLQGVPEPRRDKNRLHLDIVVPSLEQAVDRAVELGAEQVDERRTDYTWFIVLADPEGNLFCLVDLGTWERSKPPWWQHGSRHEEQQPR
jgi:predicted enzyme related to lactoylglutathione lyase